MPKIILASTSPFRQALLKKLNIAFECAKPLVDETPLPNESPEQLVERLAIAKAKKVAESYPNALIIGSDQVAVHNSKILGKPHHHENAVKQLTQFSGNHVEFLTGLCVLNSESQQSVSLVEPFSVFFKPLTNKAINQYLTIEKPYNCAGSFKSEALGITLFEKLVGDDPNTLIGLPLIKLVGLLQQHGFDVLEHQLTD